MRWRAIPAAVMSALVAACALVGGIDGDYVERTVQVCDEAMCAGVTDCIAGNCATEPCTLFNQPAGKACADGVDPDDIVCDGQGSCVECNGSEDCTDGLACDQHFCVPLHCINDQIDAGETDVDCGGADCAPCANGEHCVSPTDCMSGFCNGDQCAACMTASDCQMGFYCDTVGGVCTLLKDDGVPCSDGTECKTGMCPIQDGVCCNTACDGTCEACEQIATGAQNGTCAPVLAGTDPANDCAAGATPCSDGFCKGTDASCNAFPNGTQCRPSVGECDTAEACDGTSPDCPADGFVGQYLACSSGMCDGLGVCRMALGVGCADGTNCSSHVCTEDVCCTSICTNQCESCLVGGLVGYCSPIVEGTDPAGECNLGCCGAAGCGMANCNQGEPCTQGGECASLSCSGSSTCD